MADLYIHPSVSRTALNQLFDDFRQKGVDCHTFEVAVGEEVLVRIAPEPYSCADKRENYSLSKSFTSAAIGMAITEGILSPDTRIAELFPDKLPDIVSENLKQMTVRHLLSLSAGHDRCVFRDMSYSDDAAKTFLSAPVVNQPGTTFCYDTGASCMLGLVLERVTGMNVLDYLAEKFFPVAGIDGVWWNRTGDGSVECGVGLHASCDDIIRFGMLFACGGVLGGKRLLAEEYVRAAGSPQINFLNNGEPATHANGYGYQFWMKWEDSFDAEGSYGQYCFIYPSKRLSIAMQTESQPGHDPVPGIFDFINSMFEADTETVSVRPQEYLPLGSEERTLNFPKTVYRAKPNPMGITQFSFDTQDSDFLFRFSDGQFTQTIPAGNGHFVRSEWTGVCMMPKLDIMRGEYRETLSAACSYRMENGEITLEARLLDSPHRLTFRVTPGRDRCDMEITSTLLTDVREGCHRLEGERV